MRVRIERAKQFSGSIAAPGDKSISHRALIFAALSSGTCQIENLAPGEDVRSTARCLGQLGVPIGIEGMHAKVQGRAFSLSAPSQTLDCANSGTTMRLLSGVVAGARLSAVLDGDASLRRRPMKRVLDPLRKMGAKAEGARDEKGGETAPLRFEPGPRLLGKRHQLPVASAQVKSSLLLAGLWAEGTTEVCEPQQSRDHSERMLRAFGAPLKVGPRGILSIHGMERALSAPPSLCVPGDASSAAFFVAAALLAGTGELRISGVNTNPTRLGFLEVLRRMKAQVAVQPESPQAGEPIGTLLVPGAAPLEATEVKAEEIPSLIDEVPILSVIATQAKGTTVIRGAEELRYKESDRIAQMAKGLAAMGAAVEEARDGLRIQGPTPLKGAAIDALGDHRIAMSFAVAGLIAEGTTEIEGAEWANISFPGFFDVLSRLSRGAVAFLEWS
jgi:3-phosphoshikimate 1-carboxyvinyltransferase